MRDLAITCVKSIWSVVNTLSGFRERYGPKIHCTKVEMYVARMIDQVQVNTSATQSFVYSIGIKLFDQRLYCFQTKNALLALLKLPSLIQ